MNPYNSNYNLNKIKDDIIDNVIDDIVNSTSKTDAEKEAQRAILKSRIKKYMVITNTNVSTVNVDAENINQFSNEIYVDLLTLFATLNCTSEAINRCGVSQDVALNSIKSNIMQFRDRLESCRNSISADNSKKCFIERFKNANGFDKTSRIMQRDRSGQYFPKKCYVRYNSEESNITLPLLNRDNSLKYDNKIETASISKSFQLGRGFVDLSNKDINGVENAIDGGKRAWSETILSDAPLKTSFLSKRPKYLYLNDKYFYGMNEGAICELEIKFESINTINEIVLDPCCKYPIDILAIRFKLSDDESEPLMEIVSDDVKDIHLKSVFTKDNKTYRFPDILCKNLYILFTQRHYTRETYTYDASCVYKNTLWFDSCNKMLDKVKNAIFKPLYYGRDIISSSWQNINNKVVTSSEDIADILIGDKKSCRKVIKYEYNYGFYNIGCFNSSYDRVGFYVSKPIETKGNIKKVKLNTVEEHQKDSVGHTVTDIEYYITGSAAPTPSEWIPILPEGKEIIESEMLFITGGTRAYFRFEAEEVYAVMKNGIPIPKNSPEYHLDINKRTGKYWCVMIFNYDYDAVYSVKYKPVSGSDNVDLSNYNCTRVETFEGNNDSVITLKNIPYIDTSDNYCIVMITEVDSSIQGQAVKAKNITDIMNPSESYKNLNTSTSEFEYYIYKNTLYFNREIPKGYLIDVTYRHAITNIRTKAILRRNTVKDGWLTPVLKEIKYNIETL